MRVIIARCEVRYSGRLDAVLRGEREPDLTLFAA
jgi:RecB family endonuclease NucS